MSLASQLQRYGELAIAGGRGLLPSLLLACLAGCTNALPAGQISVDETCKWITSAQLSRSQDGTVSTDSLLDCTARPSPCKCSASPVTKRNPRRKIVSEEKTKPSLSERLKKSLEQNRLRETARDIERAAQALLGENNFVYTAESHTLATVDVSVLEALVAEIKRIRSDYETEYHFVMEKLDR